MTTTIDPAIAPAAPSPSGRVLDDQVRDARTADAPWRSSAIVAIAAVPVISLGLPLLVIATGLPRHGDGTAAYSLVGELLLGLVVWWAARRVAGRSGGWQPALGLAAPAEGDGSSIAAWSGIQFGVKVALGFLFVALVPWMRHHAGGNLTGTHELGPAGIALLVVAAVVVAPVVEEIAFRGVLLRGLMRRLSFWPAAAISSTMFGLLHAPTASALPAIPAVVVWTGVFGLVQCLLVRMTGRLTPAIGVHAIANLLTIGLALLLRA